MACTICAGIPDELVANTGRDEGLPECTRALNRSSSDWQSLWECPTCGGLYVWTEYRAQTGSGNNDDETLTRIPTERMVTIRACLERGDAPAEDVMSRVADALFAFPYVERDLVFSRIAARDRELVRAFFPRMVRDFVRTKDRWLRDKLQGWASDPSDARTIVTLMEGTRYSKTEDAFRYFMATCRRSLGE